MDETTAGRLTSSVERGDALRAEFIGADGEIAGTAAQPSFRRPHLNSLKHRFLLVLDGLARHLPMSAMLLFLETLWVGAAISYWIPGNPLRRSCRRIARLAVAAGYHHRPRAIYRRLLQQSWIVGTMYLRLYHDPPGAILPQIILTPEQERQLTRLRERYGGLVLAIPHNPAAVVYGMRLSAHFGCLLVGKKSKLSQATELVQRSFDRMGLDAVLVNRRNRVKLTRAFIRVVNEGKFLVATLDRISRKKNALRINVFGQEVGFSPWAARLAVRYDLPVLPVYVHTEGSEVRLRLGVPITQDDATAVMQSILRQFEHWFLEDPGSWAFLGDKYWQRILAAACRDSRRAGPART